MFIVYSMDGCSYCEKVIELMELTKQPHVVYTLDKQFTLEDFQSEFSTKQFPQVVHDGEGGRIKVGGARETAHYFKAKHLA